ncbi:MAG TPA: hypothetical protein VK356_07715 [Thermomicrobiales bacterium]|nr:hypothetical protein [Thermomicrobiales bacterium]
MATFDPLLTYRRASAVVWGTSPWRMEHMGWQSAVTYFTVSAGQITIVREALVTLTAAITDDPGTEEVAQQSMDSSENLITDVPVVSPPTGTHAHVADTSATAPDHDHETKLQGKGKQVKGKKGKHRDKGRKQ